VLSLITWLPIAQLALSAVLVFWDVVLAGRIAQLREAPRPFAAITGLAGLLLLPAVLAHLAAASSVTGRAIRLIDWIWPATLVLFAMQALYALFRRLVNPTWGVPIAVYDVTIAAAELVRYLGSHGVQVPDAFTLLMAAQSDALALATVSASLMSPLYLHVPMISPAFPALRNITATFRAAVAFLALAWLVVTSIEIPRARLALASYEAHAGDRLQERPAGDFELGLKILPDLASPPPAPAIRDDIALADTIGVDAVSLVIVPDIENAGLDSVARTIDLLRRDSTTLIVTLGYRGKLVPEIGHVPFDESERLSVVRRIVRRLHPDIILPAEDPYQTGARLVGQLPVETWQTYFTRAASAAKRVDPNVQVGVSISAFDRRDSALYAWAITPKSPIDVVGFSFFPSRSGMGDMDGRMRAADRWMRSTPSNKPHWVFAAGGYPLAHGERSQLDALWGTLAWATSRTTVKGVVVYEAGDYGVARGLRSPSGRLRSATFTIIRGIRGLREAARP
jgi:hypothetical protein